MSDRTGMALDSLDGLSVGDALGQQFFGSSAEMLRRGGLPPGPWVWTDDTCMAATLAAHVVRHGRVDQDVLMAAFAEDFDIGRGYGQGMIDLLGDVRSGADWRSSAASLFGGIGSFGNGSAMRIAPLGAFFHQDLEVVVEQAAAAATVTHQHSEGIAGAVATAVAAAHVTAARQGGHRPAPDEVLRVAMTAVQGTEVGAGLQRARSLGGVRPEIAAELLGNGARVTCQDTVPFCLWVAAWCLHDYPGAVAACVDGAGDVDTTCAIAGGVVGAFTGRGRRDGVLGIPLSWIEQREPLPTTVHRASLDTAGDA